MGLQEVPALHAHYIIPARRWECGNVEMWESVGICGNLWDTHPIPIPPHPHTLITHHTSHMYSYITLSFTAPLNLS